MIAETVALYGSESVSDAQIIEAMLNQAHPGRAEEVLRRATSLGDARWHSFRATDGWDR